MKKIQKISDLVIGNEYYVCFIKDARFAKKCILKEIFNETTAYKDNFLTELYLEFKKTSNLVYCKEIGIGNTKIEAKENYGKFIYENNKSFSSSYEDFKKKNGI